MIPKISLAAAFLLLMAPPMACASTRALSNAAPITFGEHQSHPGVVLAQDGQPSMGTTNNDGDSGADNDNDDNDNDSNDNDNDNQNADGNQTDQNAAGDPQQVPPTVLGSPDNDQDQSQQAPTNSYPQPVNPYQ